MRIAITHTAFAWLSVMKETNEGEPLNAPIDWPIR